MTTTGGGAPPKYLRVAAAIRRQIADGALRPGQPAPSGAELSRAFGFSTLTCRKALRALITDGLLVPGPSPNARPRVADPHAADVERDLTDATRALSAGLAARRHAAGLTQAELADLAQVSVTTVGHAETGRTWQSRRFWERADAALRAAGDLLRLHDDYRAAGSPPQTKKSTTDSIERTVASSRPARAPYRVATPPAVPPQVGAAGAGPAAACVPQIGAAQNGPAEARTVQTALIKARPVQPGPTELDSGEVATARGGTGRVRLAPVGPSRIVIVWTDGSVTTVHAPEVRTGPPDATFPDLER